MKIEYRLSNPDAVEVLDCRDGTSDPFVSIDVHEGHHCLVAYLPPELAEKLRDDLDKMFPGIGGEQIAAAEPRYYIWCRDYGWRKQLGYGHTLDVAEAREYGKEALKQIQSNSALVAIPVESVSRTPVAKELQGISKNT